MTSTHNFGDFHFCLYFDIYKLELLLLLLGKRVVFANYLSIHKCDNSHYKLIKAQAW